MILTCPSCGTQYVVKDGAIPAGGRQVRCASCKHSWHQDPEFEEEDAAAQEFGEARADEDEGERIDTDSQEQVEATPEDIPDLPQQPVEEAGEMDGDQSTWATAQEEDDFAPFGDRNQFEEEPRRNWLVTILALVVAVAVLAAAFWFLAPTEWRSRLGIARADESPLQLMLTHSQRQELASGNILLAVTGRVINPTDEIQNVPPIQAELRKKSGELVYSWTISPPARSIPPGGRAPFNSAEMNVPAEGDLLTITFGAPRA